MIDFRREVRNCSLRRLNLCRRQQKIKIVNKKLKNKKEQNGEKWMMP